MPIDTLTPPPPGSLATEVRFARGWYTTDEGETRKANWGYQNSKISSYDQSFSNVLEGRKISDLIKATTHPVVIDLMSAPNTLHTLFQEVPEVEGRGLVVGLKDHEVGEFRPEAQAAYQDPNVTMLYGDISTNKTWAEIRDWVESNGGKADLVMERAMAGLYHLPQHKRMYGMLLNRAWELVKDDGGVLLFETLNREKLGQLGISLDNWVEELKSAGLDVGYDPGDLMAKPSDLISQTGKIMLTKTPESPSVLPSI